MPDRAMVTFGPFLGTWSGLTGDQECPSPVHLLARLTTPTQIEVVLDLPAFGISAAVEGVRAAGSLLSGTFLGLPIAFRRTGHALLVEGKDALGSEVELRRGHPDVAPYLVPRLPGAAPARGRANEVVTAVCEGRMPWVDSVVVLRDGAPLVEEHFYGRRPEHLHPLHSATKSVTSLVFGCLVDDGLIDLDAPVWRYLGARQGRRWIDDKLDVRVHDVLAMSAGVDWLEEGVPHSDPSNDNSRMNRSGDWVGYVLDKPLRPDWPAGDFEYQSGLSVLAGGIIAAVAGRPVPEVARERIFTPLGIHAFRWLTTPDGTAHTGGGLMLRPRDFAALGQLVLDGGRWDGQQVLSAEWVARSTAQQSDVGDRVVWPSVTGYGYQWWRNAFECDGRTHTAVSAMGFGGQQLHVFSDLGAVVAVTAHDWLGAGALTEAAEHVLRTIAD